MGIMIDGVWHNEDPALSGNADGRFQRPASSLRSWVTRDGSPGPSGRGGHRAEPGRYHLYIAESCPWAHRTWIVRKLKALEGVVGMSTVAGMGPEGWTFDARNPKYRDQLHGVHALHELYGLGAEGYSGRVTVPVLWDTQTGTIVNNESSEIIRIFGSAFDEVTGSSLDLYPEALRDEIDAVNDRIYHGLNNGVYRAGFAATQEAYEEAFDEVFATLDWLEKRLAAQRYLIADVITEADWRLFPTLVRFDVAYVSAFRCNLRRIVDHPNLWAYTRELYQQPGVAETVVLDAYKRGYHSIPLCAIRAASSPRARCRPPSRPRMGGSGSPAGGRARASRADRITPRRDSIRATQPPGDGSEAFHGTPRATQWVMPSDSSLRCRWRGGWAKVS
jgi:putative glutathione S-transferase